MQKKPFPTSTISSAPPAHFGLTSTRELLAEGLTHSAVSRRVARGALIRRYPGVYSFGPGELSPEAQLAAALFAAGDDAVANHLSAASLWRASRWPALVPHVLLPRRHYPIDGIELHYTRRLAPLDVVVYRGIPVTTVARTLVDLSEVFTAYQLAYVMHQAAFHKRFSVSATRAAMARANGRRGLRVLARALELHLGGSAGTRSALEDAFLALVQDLPEPLVNTACEGEEVDFRWPDRTSSSRSTGLGTGVAASGASTRDGTPSSAPPGSPSCGSATSRSSSGPTPWSSVHVPVSQPANQWGERWVLPTMRLPITLAVLAATAFAPSLASAAEPVRTTAPTANENGIIAILIGQFTPPIGSNKGS